MVSQEPPTAAAGLTPSETEATYGYLETIGRVSGRRHVVELWFAAAPDGHSVFFLAGGGESANWVRNIDREPRVRVRIGGQTYEGTGRRIAGTDREPLARCLLAGKYQGWSEGRPLSRWASTSLPIGVDFGEGPPTNG